MAFIPWERCEYKTALTKNEIINRMHTVIESKGIHSNKPYKGKVYENSFTMIMKVKEDVFVPLIKGEIIDDNSNQRIIKIKMRLRYFSVGFMLFLFVPAFFMFIFAIIKSIKETALEKTGVILLVYLLFLYFVIIYSFTYGSRKAKELFDDLFELY